MAEQEYTPTEADRERAVKALARLYVEDPEAGTVYVRSYTWADEDDQAIDSLAQVLAEVRSDERAKASGLDPENLRKTISAAIGYGPVLVSMPGGAGGLTHRTADDRGWLVDTISAAVLKLTGASE